MVMALIKCKECGNEISKKADSCPSCGAKPKKKTSVWTWFVVCLIGAGLYISVSDDTENSQAIVSPAVVDRSASPAIEEPKPAKLVWTVQTAKDKMTGKLTAFAHSPSTYPDKKMSFPYSDIKSWLGVGCDGEREWVYFGFNDSPNLTNTETMDGYNLIHTRIKWDDKLERAFFSQDWGDQFIQFREDEQAVQNIAVSNNVMVELNWHGQQPALFEYSLHGSSKALKELRAKCAAEKLAAQ